MNSQVPEPNGGLMSELDHVAERSYKTYKARLKAAERLQARHGE